MVFACQLDSFQRTLFSKVKSCVEKVNNNESFFEVICEDSILFPEGGGQPWDTGFIDDIPVFQVLRKGDDAILHARKPVKVGQEVKQVVDWDRRFDHMQQHSGQHLITAVINSEYNIDTTSWWLGEEISYIELDTKQLTNDQIQNIELLVNKKILEQTEVVVNLCKKDSEAVKNARTRGLPNDVVEPIRIVEIVGLESDLCCGTHVSNLGQLQCIKLLYGEKGKKNKINLVFLSGGRVLKYLAECLNREQKLTKLLKCEPASHADLTLKLQQNIKSCNKKLNSLLKELAEYEVFNFKNISPQPRYYTHYKAAADSDYIDAFWRKLRDDNMLDKTFFMLAAGEEKGCLLLQGNDNEVKDLAPKILDLLEGKGAAHGSKFYAKVSKLTNFEKAKSILSLYFNGKEN